MTGYDSKRQMAANKLQEPVAWMYQCTADNSGPVLLRHRTNWAESNSGLWIETPLYTAPLQRKWVGLTDADIADLDGQREKAITAIKEALAQSAQEPVARVSGTYNGRFVYEPLNPATILPVGMALYSAPQENT